MTDIERLALLGDRKAQAECTFAGIALACPFCGKELEKSIQTREYATGCSISEVVYEHPEHKCLLNGRWISSEELAAWNTRPAPPIGRCGTCKRNHLRGGKWFCEVHGIVHDHDNFCRHYKSKEDET